MGKSRHRNKTRSEDEERRKMRESILKIFHERAQSPEGALLVNGSIVQKPSNKSTEGRSFSAARSLHHYRDQNPVDSSSSFDSQNDQQATSTRKRKRHRKVMTGQEVGKRDNTAAVSLHAKSARTYSYKGCQDKSRKAGSRDQCVDHITHNRLTRGVGLFNPGKKSKTIYREPIQVPDTIEQDVEKTLKHILNKTEDDQEGAESNMEHSQKTCRWIYSFTPESDPYHHTLSGNQRSTHGSGQSQVYVEHSPVKSSGVSPADLDSFFPETVPYQEIASSMLSYLQIQTKKAFKDRDILGDTCGELKKMLQESSRTPQVTRVSEKLMESRKRSLDIGSTRRSFLTSFHKCSPESASLGSHCQGTNKKSVPGTHASSTTCSNNPDSTIFCAAYRAKAAPRLELLIAGQPDSLSVHERAGHKTHHFVNLIDENYLSAMSDSSAFSLPLSAGCDVNFKSDVMDFSHGQQRQVNYASDPSYSNRRQDVPTSRNQSLQIMNIFPSIEQAGTGQKGRTPEESGDARKGPLENPLHLFPQNEPMEMKDRDEASREVIMSKGGDCDMELDPQIVDGSKGLMLNQSAIQMLQCNDFISRVSSLCGETEGSPDDHPAQVNLHSFIHNPLLAGRRNLGQACGRSVLTKPAQLRGDGMGRAPQRSSFMSQLMDRTVPSSTASSLDRPNFDLAGHLPQQGTWAGDVSVSPSHASGHRYPRKHSFAALNLQGCGEPALPIGGLIVQSECVRGKMDTKASSLSTHCPADLLDHLDFFSHQDLDLHHLADPEAGDRRSVSGNHGNWQWDKSWDILPPLRKPSLASPSPPHKLSPHKWC